MAISLLFLLCIFLIHVEVCRFARPKTNKAAITTCCSSCTRAVRLIPDDRIPMTQLLDTPDLVSKQSAALTTFPFFSTMLPPTQMKDSSSSLGFSLRSQMSEMMKHRPHVAASNVPNRTEKSAEARSQEVVNIMALALAMIDADDLDDDIES